MRRKYGRNLLRNPSFELGREFPSHWQWRVVSGRPMWTFDYDVKFSGRRCVKIIQDVGVTHGEFFQIVKCRPSVRYRLRARIRTALEGTGEQAGANLSIASLRKGRTCHRLYFRPMLLGREDWTLWSVDYVTPARADALVVRFDIRNSDGVAWFDCLELFEVPEPLPKSVSPPMATEDVAACSPPRSRVHVVTSSVSGRLVGDVLSPLVGPQNVSTSDSTASLARNPADAVFILDDARGRRIPFATLLRLASKALVVMTPRAFARSVAPAVRVREIEDSLVSPCARVLAGSSITRGLRPGDVFDCSFAADSSGVRRQVQLRSTRDALARLRMETLAVSVCGASRDSRRPLILYRPTARGGILVMDLSALLYDPILGNDPNLLCLILSNALGRPQTFFGAYVAPRFDYDHFCRDLRLLADRCPSLALSREGASGLGRPVYSISLGPSRAPVFYVDCAIHPDEWAPPYGVLMYLARLASEYDRGLPWARAMLRNLRLKCIPVIAPDGWDRSDRAPRGINLNRNFAPFWRNCPDKDKGTAALSEPETRIVDRILRRDRVVAAVNFHETSANTNWVGFPSMSGRYTRYVTAVPSIFAQVIDNRHFWRQPSVWTQTPDRRNYHCHYTDSFPYLRNYSASKSPFEIVHADSLGIDGILVEQYGNSDFVFSASPQRTDMTGFIMEMLLGLRIGLVCRNPRSEPLDLTIPIKPKGRRAHALVYSPEGELLDKRPLVRIRRTVCAKAALPPNCVLLVDLGS